MLDLVTLRSAVVGGFPAGGLRRDRSATVITRRSSSPLRGAMKWRVDPVSRKHAIGSTRDLSTSFGMPCPARAARSEICRARNGMKEQKVGLK